MSASVGCLGRSDRVQQQISTHCSKARLSIGLTAHSRGKKLEEKRRRGIVNIRASMLCSSNTLDLLAGGA
ncbi:uncharacterized protein TRIVIDRAFT_216087 [Trichoderma virens Gv29-8]|uniref:Uncharacterized protein n=1 Tax=Hypocrea virens (strain Gv29-8 / FGSC 10586) TaxID=413071 RepID=G9MRG8_HYPVG|nr:uncharacterized protein TRIVIDRAFT_216087 [Trichoderma virens Gv29-8]EHK22690.1 hypothetical protein TRIVIDRAFT_216087 [Trichoderma virens Gv29-8]